MEKCKLAITTWRVLEAAVFVMRKLLKNTFRNVGQRSTCLTIHYRISKKG